MKSLLSVGTLHTVVGCPFYCLIVPDPTAGHSSRYTVYKVPLKPSGKIKTIGREQTLKFARLQIRAEFKPSVVKTEVKEIRGQIKALRG